MSNVFFMRVSFQESTSIEPGRPPPDAERQDDNCKSQPQHRLGGACRPWTGAVGPALAGQLQPEIDMPEAVAEHGERHARDIRSEENTSELQSLMRLSYAV